MKRFVAFILCICCITLLFSGCKQPPIDGPEQNTSGQIQGTQPTQSTTQPTAQPTEPTTQPTEPATQPTEPVKVEDIEGPLAQYVQTAIKETIVFAGDRYGNKQSTPVRIPKLLPFSEDAIACQTEIQNEFDSMVEEIRNEHASGHTSATAFIDYYAYLNGTIFSLVIYAESMFDLGFYRVYNFDIETGKRLDTEGLMNKLQIVDYTEKFTQVANTAFEKKYSHFQKNDSYQAQLATTIGKENIDKVMPYVAEDGKVMVVINIYALAGAEYYPEAFPLS